MKLKTRLIAIGIGVATAAASAMAIASAVGTAPHPQQPPATKIPTKLPQLGAQLTPLPDGAGKAAAETTCLPCHASDIIRQQRLTKQQWTATLTKMANWGADVSDPQKEVLLEYLVTHFGPDNVSFQPAVTRPVGR